MSATAKLTEKSLEDLSDAEFEALLQARRGLMKGLQLTDAQRKKALEYSGPMNLGSDDLPKR